MRWENDLDYLGEPDLITSVYGRVNQTDSNPKRPQPNFPGRECRWTKGPQAKKCRLHLGAGKSRETFSLNGFRKEHGLVRPVSHF